MAVITVYVSDVLQIIGLVNRPVFCCINLETQSSSVKMSTFLRVSLHGSQGVLSNHLAQKHIFELLRSGSTS